MPEGEAGERRGCVRVGVRRPLALEVREEEDAVRTCFGRGCLGDEVVERRSRRERVVEPLQRAGRVQHHAHRLPRLGDGVAERVHARLGLVGVPRERREDDTGRAEHDRDEAGPDDADSERGGLLVSGTRVHRRLAHRRQPRARDLERGQYLVAPAPVRDVEEERPGRIGGVDRPLPGEPEPDVVLRQHDARDPRVHVGLVLPQPQQLRGREARQRAVPGERDEPLETDALLDLGALRARALVVPEDRGPEDGVVLVEADQAVHLAREAHALRLDAERRERCPARAHPVVGVLLRPPRVR